MTLPHDSDAHLYASVRDGVCLQSNRDGVLVLFSWFCFSHTCIDTYRKFYLFISRALRTNIIKNADIPQLPNTNAN